MSKYNTVKKLKESNETLSTNLEELTGAITKLVAATNEASKKPEEPKTPNVTVADTLVSQVESSSLGKSIISLINSPAATILGAAINTIKSLVTQIESHASDSLTNIVNLTNEQMPLIESRLQGLTDIQKEDGKYWNAITSDLIETNLYSQTDYLKNIAELTSKGIAYNLEDRALMATIGDKLVSTFEVTNDNLLSLIRIQGNTDLTVAQMGSESMITTLLNSMFSDTSYLNSLYDSTSANLLSASSLLNASDVVGFEYNVQKWLGALYSAGMSESSINTLSKAIGDIGSGDISNLSTLLALSSANGGIDISEVLQSGWTADSVNSLMYSLVAWMQSANGGDNVLKSQLASIFGLSTSDFKAASNISQAQMNAISSSSTDYSSSTNEILDNLVDNLSTRTNVQEKISNYFSNAWAQWALDLANDEAAYVIYKTIEQISGSSNTAAGIWAIASSWAESAFPTSEDEVIAHGEGYNILDELTDGVFQAKYASSNGGGDILTALLDSYDAGVINSRGTGFSVSGLGTSSSQIYSQSGDSSIKYYESSSSGTSTTSADSTVSGTLEDLCARLFNDSTAIGVQVRGFDTDAITALVNGLGDMNGNGQKDIVDILTAVGRLG